MNSFRVLLELLGFLFGFIYFISIQFMISVTTIMSE